MYAVTARSSSAYKLASVNNEVKVQARKFAAPQSTASTYNQSSSVAGASGVQIATPSASSPASGEANKASQITPIVQANANNHTNQHKFSRPQQRKINRFNLEMVNETPKNVNSHASASLISQSRSLSNANKFIEIPYLIAMANQSLANMKPIKEDDLPEDTEPEAEENIENTQQHTSKII